MTIYKANDRYRAKLRSTWVAAPAATTLEVTSVPNNVPTIVVVGWGTEIETKFSVTNFSGTDPSSYVLTGVVRLEGANENLPAETAVNCLNNEEFFNQYGSEITALSTASLPTGGTTGQILQKKTNTNYDTEWSDYTPPADTGVPTPVGSIMPWAGTDPPAGYLMCDGSAVSRTTYADLFTIIGTTYGAGDGSTTFNVPDLRGRVTVGKTSGGGFDNLAETGGTLTHRHYGTGLGGDLRAAIGAINNTATSIGYTGTSAGDPAGSATPAPMYAITGGGLGYTNWNHWTTVYGYTSSTSTLQPYQVVNYIIKALYISTLDWSSSAGSFLTGSDSGWTAVTLQNGWQNYDATWGPADLKYIRKIGSIVAMRGLIKSGTTTYGTVIFNLPVGWRPSYPLILRAEDTTTDGWEMRIETSGNVIVGDDAPNNSWASMACTFFAG